MKPIMPTMIESFRRPELQKTKEGKRKNEKNIA
jgi:hypothetical protein